MAAPWGSGTSTSLATTRTVGSTSKSEEIGKQIHVLILNQSQTKRRN